MMTDLEGHRRDDSVHPNRSPGTNEGRPNLPDEMAQLGSSFGVKFADIRTEKYREYERPQGGIYRIDAPQWLYVSPTKNHYVVDADRVVHCIHADLTRPIVRWSADPLISYLPST